MKIWNVLNNKYSKENNISKKKVLDLQNFTEIPPTEFHHLERKSRNSQRPFCSSDQYTAVC